MKGLTWLCAVFKCTSTGISKQPTRFEEVQVEEVWPSPLSIHGQDLGRRHKATGAHRACCTLYYKSILVPAHILNILPRKRTVTLEHCFSNKKYRIHIVVLEHSGSAGLLPMNSIRVQRGQQALEIYSKYNYKHKHKYQAKAQVQSTNTKYKNRQSLHTFLRA